MKRIYTLLLAMLLLFSNIGEIVASEIVDSGSMNESTVTEVDLPTGLQEVEAIGIPETELQEKVLNYEELAEIAFQSAIYDDEWDKYATNYYYNQLPEEQKALWDALDTICLNYLNTTQDISESARLDFVSVPENMTIDDIVTFWNLYMFSNPQYYFLKNYYSYSYIYDGDDIFVTSFSLYAYKAFCDGEARLSATNAVKKQINIWLDQVKSCKTDEERVKMIFNLICNKVDYNYDFVNGKVTEEDAFTQSAYSVLCKDLTVCAGYSDTLALMCNAVGIDAISVTSYNHQWNKIRINDSWYNFDATWGDQSYGIYYEFYARSDAYYDKASQADSHQEEEFWSVYIPACTLDTNPASLWDGPGTYPLISSVAETPKITANKEGDSYKVTITCATPSSTIYYTVDGTEPSSAYTKSVRYIEPFYVGNLCQIKAIATCDTYLDSKIVSIMTALDVPTISVKATGYDSVKVSWDLVDGAAYYEVYGKKATDSSYKRYGVYTAEIASKVVKGLESKTEYYFKVRCFKAVNGKKVYSGYSKVLSVTPKLATPTKVNAIRNSYNSVKITWDKVDEATYYQVWRSTNPNSGFKKLGTYTIDTLSSISKQLACGTKYYYKVRAYKVVNKKAIYSDYSSVVSATPTLSAPTGVTATRASSTTVKITWKKVEGAVYYQLYRATSKNGKYSLLGTFDADTTSRISKSLKTGTRYYYKVRCYRWQNGERVFSEYSSIVSATP